MSNKLFQSFKDEQKRTDLPQFKPGDVIKVYQEVTEDGQKKVHPFEGIVIAKKGGDDLDATFTVRTKIKGVGVERTFPLHSPTIKKIEVEREATRSRRAKHYWVRDRTDREIRKKLKWRKADTN